jgi:hypothetical protein
MKRVLHCAVLLAAGCNAITNVGKYDLDDCLDANCVAGDGSDDAGTDGAAEGANADAAADSAPPFACTGPDLGRAPLTVTVSGALSVSGTGIVVPPGQTVSACVPPNDQYRLEVSSGGSARWSGVTCKDGPSGNRCEFFLTAADGAIVTATE